MGQRSSKLAAEGGLASVEKGSEAARCGLLHFELCVFGMHALRYGRCVASRRPPRRIGAVMLSKKLHAGTPLTRALSGWPGRRQGCENHIGCSSEYQQLCALAPLHPRLMRGPPCQRGGGPAQRISCCSSKANVQMLIELLFLWL